MKKIITFAIASCFLFSCESTKVPSAPDKAGSSAIAALNGEWQLDYISGPRIAFEGLYPDKKPAINFNLADSSFSGNSGCNSFRGKFLLDGAAINFPDAMAMTKMMCPGEGETVFMGTLKKINKYAISQDTTLTLIMGDIALMRFVKK